MDQSLVPSEHLNEMEEQERAGVLDARDRAWLQFRNPIEEERFALLGLIQKNLGAAPAHYQLEEIMRSLRLIKNPNRRDLMESASAALIALRDSDPAARRDLIEWKRRQDSINARRYGSNL